MRAVSIVDRCDEKAIESQQNDLAISIALRSERGSMRSCTYQREHDQYIIVANPSVLDTSIHPRGHKQCRQDREHDANAIERDRSVVRRQAAPFHHSHDRDDNIRKRREREKGHRNERRPRS